MCHCVYVTDINDRFFGYIFRHWIFLSLYMYISMYIYIYIYFTSLENILIYIYIYILLKAAYVDRLCI